MQFQSTEKQNTETKSKLAARTDHRRLHTEHWR